MSKKVVRKKKKPNHLVSLIVVLLVAIGSGVLYIYTEEKTNNLKVSIMLDARGDINYPGIEDTIIEQDYNNALVDALYDRLSEDEHFRVYKTHEKDEASAAKDRGQFADEANCSMMLSFGVNESSDEMVSGMQIFVEPPTYRQHEKSLEMANAIASEFKDENVTMQYCYFAPLDEDMDRLHLVGVEDTTKYEEDTLPLFEATKRPCVIVNGFYASNKNDYDKWASNDGIQEAADRYYKAIKDVYGK